MRPKLRQDRTLYASDLHLRNYIWSRRPEISGDAYWGLEQIVRLAVLHRVDQVVLAGDIFDSHRPSAEDVQRFSHAVAELNDHGISVLTLEGQHDRDSRYLGEARQSIYTWAKICGAASADRQVFDMGGFACYGLSYRNADELFAELAAIPTHVDTLVCHQPWKELMPPQARYVGELVQDVPGHIFTVFTGDRHACCCLPLCRAASPVFHVYASGATYLCKSNEPETHKVFLIDDRKVEMLELCSRTVFRASLRTEDDFLRLSATLEQYRYREDVPDSVKTPLVFVEIPDSRCDWQDRLESLPVHVLARPLLSSINSEAATPGTAEASLPADTPTDTPAEAETDIHETVRRVTLSRLADDPEALVYADRLLHCRDLREELRLLRQKLEPDRSPPTGEDAATVLLEDAFGGADHGLT